MNENEIKSNIQATFDDVSSQYDGNKFFAISAKRMSELIPSFDSMNILDVSTGTGAVAIALAKKFRQANIEGVDLSLGMLNLARNKARREGLENIKFVQCDVDKMPYADQVFNVVTCGYALFFYPNMEAAFHKICRTIKCGGVFVFSSFTNEAFNPYSELFFKRLEVDYKIGAPSRFRERLKTKQQIKDLVMLGQHKSFNIEHYPITDSITLNDWWSLCNSAGYKSLLNQLTEKQLSKFKQDHLAEIRSNAVDGLIELNTDTLFGVVEI